MCRVLRGLWDLRVRRAHKVRRVRMAIPVLREPPAPVARLDLGVLRVYRAQLEPKGLLVLPARRVLQALQVPLDRRGPQV